MYRVIEIENGAEYQSLTNEFKTAMTRLKQAALFAEYAAIKDEGGKVIREIGRAT
jgi:hypothetical protein